MQKSMVTLAILVLLSGTALAQDTLTAPGPGPHYDFTTIDFPGAINTLAVSVNDEGKVVGRYDYDGLTLHGFLLRNGVFTTIDVPNAATTQARSINDRGQIVGVWVDSVGIEHGYLLDKGVFSPLEFPGAANTAALGINDRGAVVGRFNMGDPNTFIGFLRRRGHFTSFEVPDSFPQSTVAESINDRGQIVGWSTDVDGIVLHGFLLDHGRFTSIDVPGALSATLPFGINEKGQISGLCDCIDGLNHGFVLSSGKFTIVDFPAPGSSTGVRKINNRGQIVGSYSQSPSDGVSSHGFIATPADGNDD